MKYWQYKAYDAGMNIKTGVAAGDNYLLVILHIRQCGLQIFDMHTITKEYYKMQAATQPKLMPLRPDNKPRPIVPYAIYLSIFFLLLLLYFVLR